MMVVQVPGEAGAELGHSLCLCQPWVHSIELLQNQGRKQAPWAKHRPRTPGMAQHPPFPGGTSFLLIPVASCSLRGPIPSSPRGSGEGL